MARSRSGTSVASLLKMRSLGSIGFAAVLLFYVAWPLYAGYDIKTSLDGRNVEALNARVDFASVRTSLKPAVTAKVDKVVSDALRKTGAAGAAIADRFKAQVMPRIVEGVLATLVTPEMMIRIHASGRSLKEALDGLVLERASQTQGIGGGLMIVSGDTNAEGRSRIEEIAGALGIDSKTALGGAAAEDAASGAAPSEVLPARSGPLPKYGLGNIKHFSLTGPLGLSIGVSRDAGGRKPELTADLSFTGGSWKLTGLAPEK
jgi:hypothetical protein